MAKFDVYEVAGDPGFLLDCQADVFWQLDTRFVVPLLPKELSPPVLARLNPFFDVDGERVVMVTQSASAVPARILGRPMFSLTEHQFRITDAIDMLLTGY